MDDQIRMKDEYTTMNIFVNDTAAVSGGALSILTQFMDNIENNNANGNCYWIFVAGSVRFDERKNVSFVAVDTKSFRKRLAWDRKGLKQWSQKNNITPDLIISLQNTAVKGFGNIPQIVYYHQLLPLVPYRWNPLSKRQRPLFIYKYLYPIFVKRSLSACNKVVVQQEWIKKAFSKRFKFPKENIMVFNPDVSEIDIDKIEPIDFADKQSFRLFYPANTALYKNHICIVSAVNELKKRGAADNLKVYFTCREDKGLKFVRLISKYGLSSNFVFLGAISYQEVLKYYHSCDALVFPSYIETFGLPILEASKFGLPILCSDLEYTREIVGDYEGACFIEPHNSDAWADAIERTAKLRPRFEAYKGSCVEGWKEFFDMINTL